LFIKSLCFNCGRSTCCHLTIEILGGYIIEALSGAQARSVAQEFCLEKTVKLPGHIKSVQEVELLQ